VTGDYSCGIRVKGTGICGINEVENSQNIPFTAIPFSWFFVSFNKSTAHAFTYFISITFATFALFPQPNGSS